MRRFIRCCLAWLRFRLFLGGGGGGGGGCVVFVCGLVVDLWCRLGILGVGLVFFFFCCFLG